MKVALVHDHIQEFGGAERVLVSLKKLYPEADVYTSFYTPSGLGIHAKEFKDWNIITSWADKVPFLKKLYSPFRFLMPYIWESFNFKEYDLVISSSSWFMCKGIITRPEVLHICYMHSPPRSFYFYETAVEWQKYTIFKIYGTLVNHGLRIWDFLASQRPDYLIANSQEMQKRIQKLYRRDSTVIYPPVTIPKSVSVVDEQQEPYYITISRLTRAKHIDVLIKAANEKKFKLKIVGSGRDEEYLKSLAGPTVEFLGHLPDEKFHEVISDAKAFLFASVDEEFGIVVVEALGHGTPVIALKSGGVPEIIEGHNVGFLYDELAPQSLNEKIDEIESLSQEKYQKMREDSRKRSEFFSEKEFDRQIMEFVNSKLGK
jgi:glycosyltransferase involved in cell wall biosynthesis